MHPGVRATLIILTAVAFAFAGLEMISLRSQSGTSVAEAFDNAMGIFSFGMAGLTLIVGLPYRPVGRVEPVDEV